MLTGTEFNEMNRRGDREVDDHSRVVLARIMARDADLPPHEQEKLERWAEDLMSQPTVTVTLTERERARLWERLQETFKGDRGAVLGFTEVDRGLAVRFGIEIAPPRGEFTVDYEVDEWPDLSLPTGGALSRPPKSADRTAEERDEMRRRLEDAARILEDVAHHASGADDPVQVGAVANAREALSAAEAGIALLERADFEARGIGPEEAERRKVVHLAEYRARREAEPGPPVWKRPGWAADKEFRDRFRLRKEAVRTRSTIPAEGRTAMEPVPTNQAELARRARIEAAAAALLRVLRPQTEIPVDRPAEVLLMLEQTIIKRYDPRTSLQDYYLNLPSDAVGPARELVAAIRGVEILTTERAAALLRVVLRWICDQAICFSCRQYGQCCGCEPVASPGRFGGAGSLGSSGN
ncbi:MAG TPA: hypothetical protein VFQ45_16660 [Longimicrobium sp.]|nr:hypothetical protein [Longimicrobium sp.]